MAVSLYDSVWLGDTGSSWPPSDLIGIPSATGTVQIIVLTVLGTSVPGIPSVTVGGTAATALGSVTFDYGSTTTYRYGRAIAYKSTGIASGVRSVSVSGTGVGYWEGYAYSFSGVYSTSYKGSLAYGASSASYSFTSNYAPSAAVVSGIIVAKYATLDTASTGITIDHQQHYSSPAPTLAAEHDMGGEDVYFNWSTYGTANYSMVSVLLDTDETANPVEVIPLPYACTAATYPLTVTISSAPQRLFCDPLLLSGNNDGTSWEDAYRSFPYAVTQLDDLAGDSLYVKAGEITDLVAQIDPVNNCNIYGGFSRSLTGISAVVGDRKPFSDKTIIKMGINNYPAYGELDPYYYGCIDSGSDDVLINGFHFYDCKNVAPSSGGHGGAIRIDTADGWTVSNCYFLRCTVDDSKWGGAICALECTGLTVYNCKFNNCGGAIAGDTIGGGLAMVSCDADVISCWFYACYATNGGAIAIQGAVTNDLMIRSVETDLCNSSYGDSLYVIGPSVDIDLYWCRFNNGIGSDSAVYYSMDSAHTLYMSRSLIVGGAADGIKNKGVSSYDSAVITNCTVADNDGYGIAYSPGGSRSCEIYNSIIWDNTTGAISGTLDECQYSDIEGGYSGTGNVNVDPEFRGSGDPERYALNSVTTCVDGGNSSVTGYLGVDLVGYSVVDTPDMGAMEFQGTVWPPGAIDTSLYRLHLSGCQGTATRPMKFVVPYLCQETTGEMVGFNFGTSIFDSIADDECYPLQFGSEMMNTDTDAYLNEVWTAENSKQSIYRSSDSAINDPSWEVDFSDKYQADETYIGTLGTKPRGIKFEGTFKNESHPQLYELIRYSCAHSDLSLVEDMFVYNLWIEGMSEVEKDTEDCARWIGGSTSVSTPDLPVSAGTMIELLRIINRIVWEFRNPVSVPVFGRYYVETAEIPPV